MQLLDGKRILIVEDDIINMAVYNAILRNTGARVLQDFWNTDTVDILSKHLPVDLVILDLMLRYEMSGYDTFDKLKMLPEAAGIPIVAVSAADPDIEMPKARAKGFMGYIAKPIDPLLFPRQIADCIAGKPVWSAPLYTEGG